MRTWVRSRAKVLSGTPTTNDHHIPYKFPLKRRFRKNIGTLTEGLKKALKLTESLTSQLVPSIISENYYLTSTEYIESDLATDHVSNTKLFVQYTL